MTVKELMEALKDLPSDIQVYIDHCDYETTEVYIHKEGNDEVKFAVIL